MSPSRIALHEAGHAVVSAHFGLRVAVIRLWAHGGVDLGDWRCDGYVMHSDNIRKVDPDHWVPMLLAGRAAEREWCKGAAALDPAQRDQVAARDIRQATQWCEAFYPDPHKQFRRADMLAHVLVIQHSKLGIALAEKLDTRKSMTGDEFESFLWAQSEAA